MDDLNQNTAVPPDAPAHEDAAENANPEAAATPVSADPLTEARALADENKAGWQRAIADYANLKRDMERTTADLSKYAVSGFLGKLLPVVDSFRKATEQRPLKEDGTVDETRIKQWIEGVTLIRSQLDAVLANAGVKAIDTAGVPFDPNMHEAMMMQPATPDFAAGTVMNVLEPGYLLHEKVIRPAKVVVAE